MGAGGPYPYFKDFEDGNGFVRQAGIIYFKISYRRDTPLK
jgi:hypothetical protein